MYNVYNLTLDMANVHMYNVCNLTLYMYGAGKVGKMMPNDSLQNVGKLGKVGKIGKMMPNDSLLHVYIYIYIYICIYIYIHICNQDVPRPLVHGAAAGRLRPEDHRRYMGL